MLLFWNQYIISMAFSVCNSEAGVQAWNQEADVSIFWNLANCNSVHTYGWLYFGFTEGSFLLLNGQKYLRSVAEDLISTKQNNWPNLSKTAKAWTL